MNQAAQPPVWATRTPVPADVLRYALSDHIVALVIEHWKKGGFRSWEDAMTACVCYLAEERANLLRRLQISEASRADRVVGIDWGEGVHQKGGES